MMPFISQVKNKAAAAKRNSVMYLKRGKVLKKNLGG